MSPGGNLPDGPSMTKQLVNVNTFSCASEQGRLRRLQAESSNLSEMSFGAIGD